MFKVELNRRNITNEELIDDMNNVADRLGKKTITSIEYDEYGNFGKTTILRRFGGWNKALEASSLIIKNRQNIANEEFFENIAEVWRHIGRQPVGNDLNKAHGVSKISTGAYEKKFGSWNKALLMFIEYINGGSFGNETFPHEIEKNKSTSRTSRKINWRIRAKILIRDNCICKMCGASPAKNPDVDLHVDHIIPWTKGGETVIENLQTLCSICNIGKSDILT